MIFNSFLSFASGTPRILNLFTLLYPSYNVEDAPYKPSNGFRRYIKRPDDAEGGYSLVLALSWSWSARDLVFPTKSIMCTVCFK